MDKMEKVELLRTKADVSYEEAKMALEEAGWDLLDAIVALERQGKVGRQQHPAPEAEAEAKPVEETVEEAVKEAETIPEEEAPSEGTIEEAAADVSAEEIESPKAPVIELTLEPEEAEEPEDITRTVEAEADQEKDQKKEEEKIMEERQTTQEQTGKEKKKGRLGKAIRKLIRGLRHSTFQVNRDGANLVTVPSILFALILVLGFKWVAPVMIIALFFRVSYQFVGEESFQKANEFMGKASDMAEDVKKEFGKDASF